MSNPAATTSTSRRALAPDEVRANLRGRFPPKPALIPTAFPPSTDLLFALLKEPSQSPGDQDELNALFREYFTFGRHRVDATPRSAALRECAKEFPWSSTLPASCVSLGGERGLYSRVPRLFAGDVAWLHYQERFGTFRILNALLDDYAVAGKYPLSSAGSGGDPLPALVFEAMVREVKTGRAVTTRERDSTYRRSLGWTSEAGRKLGGAAEVNRAFEETFHKFLRYALEYYKEKRLAVAIRGSAQPAPPPSVATLTTIGDTIQTLRSAFKPFEYGRNHMHALAGVVWVLGTMALVREVRTSIGIPEDYRRADEFMPAAYDLLVLKRPINASESTRYVLHKTCAEAARDVLLDLEVVDFRNPAEVEGWLDLVEPRIEGYRTAYRTLTGEDLGGPNAPRIEQRP